MNQDESRELFKSAIRKAWPAHRPLRILEAGGGAKSVIPVPDQIHITTIDIDADQIRMNKEKQISDVAILGDLQEHEWEANSFDVVVCNNVLEHVPMPELALAQLEKSLDRGGLFIVCGPILESTRSVIIRYTPHWFHVFYYRYFMGKQTAGRAGYAPFKTSHAQSSDHHAIVKFLTDHAYEEVLLSTYRSKQVDRLQEKSPFLFGLYQAFGKMMKAVKGSDFCVNDSDFRIVYRKTACSPVNAASGATIGTAAEAVN